MIRGSEEGQSDQKTVRGKLIRGIGERTVIKGNVNMCITIKG